MREGSAVRILQLVDRVLHASSDLRDWTNAHLRCGWSNQVGRASVRLRSRRLPQARKKRCRWEGLRLWRIEETGQRIAEWTLCLCSLKHRLQIACCGEELALSHDWRLTRCCAMGR